MDGRWIWIDSTWSRPGNSGGLYDSRYFDAAELFLARSHVAMSTKSNDFKAGDKGLIPEETQRPDLKDIPSAWAQAQVDAAIQALLPENLQGAYRENITRQEAASMLARTAKVLDIPAGKGQSFGDDGDIASWAKEGVDFTSGLTDPATGDRVMGALGMGSSPPGPSIPGSRPISPPCGCPTAGSEN